MTQFSHKILKYLDKIDRTELEHIVQELDQDLSVKDQLLNQIQEGILIAGDDQKINYVNETFLRLTQFKKENLMELNLTQLLDRFKLMSSDLIQTLYSEQQSFGFDFIFEDDSRRWMRMHAIPQLNSDSKLTSVLISLLDISEFKEFDEKRTFTEKWNTLIPLAAGLAHEIGNPLNALNIHMQLALRETQQLPTSKKEKLSKCLSIAQEEINRMDRIVANFLGAVRPLKGNQRLHQINEVLDSALDFMAPEASQFKVGIERRFQTNLPQILLDEDQLKQAFINLIKNALHSMQKGGLLQVQTDRINQHIRIVFKDSGHGMRKEEIDHIFEPYYSTKEKGSGLGLVAVKRIISNHGGSIKVDSTLNKGSTFTLLLPLLGAKKPLLPDSKKRSE